MHDDIEAVLARQHGVISTQELTERGYRSWSIAKLVSDGLLQRHSRGWYRLATMPLNDFARARMAGGAVTCVSALKHLGYWVPESNTGLHLRTNEPQRAHDRHFIAKEALPDEALDSFTGVMLSAQRCCELEELVAVLDAAANRGEDITSLAEHSAATLKLKRAVGMSGHRADSAQESLVRVHLTLLGLKFQTHVQRGVFELDFLIGEYLVVECDGFAYHSSQSDLIRDRKKDRYLESLGMTTLRFAYWDVIERWPECQAQILSMVRAEKHRYPTSRRVDPFEIDSHRA